MEERPDPFSQRPLSSTVSRVGVLYPNTDARKMAAHANANFYARHHSTKFKPETAVSRAGGARPFSSHNSPILKIRQQDPTSKGEMTTAGRTSIDDIHQAGDFKPKGGDRKDSAYTREGGRRLTQTTTQDVASSTHMHHSAGGIPPSTHQLNKIRESQRLLQ